MYLSQAQLTTLCCISDVDVCMEVKQVEQVFTCKFGLVVGQSLEAVGEWGEDALHRAKHGAES